ncbi:phage protein Gp37 [Desulfovibrio falkowii]|uniref:DUF1834 family protein n=1 Tax=Desulfovibrio falkowii TaxID=3136602 RepID=A0ABQ0EAG2_9BACT
MLPITEIENGIIEQIAAARLPYLRLVASYGGELVGDWQGVIRAVPAVWVTFKDSTPLEPQSTARTRFLARLSFTTIVAARSSRNEAASRKGGPGNVGSYQMLDDVARLICMQDFGLDGVDHLRPGRTRSLFNAKTAAQALSVMSQEWTATVQFRLREPGQAPLPEGGAAAPTGYLPPEGQTFPGAANVNNPAPLPELNCLRLQYWLKPPQDMATDPPVAEDHITLQIQV